MLFRFIFVNCYHWRLQDFGSGGDQGETARKAPTQVVRGAKAPRTVVKFHFKKRFKVLENESIFQKYPHFFLPENPFFPKKKFQNRTYFTRISKFFEKIYKILIFLEELYKSREIPDELYYLVETFIKKSQKIV